MIKMKSNRKPSFSLECFTVSEAAMRALSAGTIRDALRRHQRGDWGSVTRDQQRWNDACLQLGDGDLESVFQDAQVIRRSVQIKYIRLPGVNLTDLECIVSGCLAKFL